jgi:hypothetical protein
MSEATRQRSDGVALEAVGSQTRPASLRDER